MFKSVSEFSKLFAFLFLITGLFFLLQKNMTVSAVAFATFVIVFFIDTDWAFENLNFSNHNLVVGVVTFISIFVNVFFIFQEMRYTPLFNQVDTTAKEAYLKFENKLFEDIKPCSDRHNLLFDKVNNKQEVAENEAKYTQNVCYDVISKIENEPIPDGLPTDIKRLSTENRTEMKRIAINLTSYNYSQGASQKALNLRIRDNFAVLVKNMEKIRQAMRMQEEIEDTKKNFVKI